MKEMFLYVCCKSKTNYFTVIEFTVVLFLVYNSISSVLPEYISHDHQHNLTCVNWKQAPEAKVGNCTRYGRNGPLRCFGGMNNLQSITVPNVRKLEDIILCGWPTNVFNPLKELRFFPKLRALTIEYSGFTEISLDFPEMFYLQTINISFTNLSHISARTFKRIHELKTLDLRWNQLTQLDGPLCLPSAFQQLYLAGNPWNCTRNFKWLLTDDKGLLVADRDTIICTDRKYKDKQMMMVMHYKKILKEQCLSHPDLQNCTCSMHHILPKSHIPLYSVNCSNLDLYRLPAFLPENSTILYANDNKISDINPLRHNEHYRKLTDLHLDNNLVENIDELENTYWLENFRVLSLRGNKLRKVHVYALDNALEDNHLANILQLSENPWFCTCKFAMRLKELLIKYNDIINDASNMTCSYTNENEEVRYAKLLSITRQDVCVSTETEAKIRPIDWLNAALASAIVFVLGKLAYDYYHYKYYGRVPWIVMKLP